MKKQPGACTIKLFTAISYDFLKIVRVFASVNPIQLSLMFAGKAGAYTQVKHFSGAPR
jgi:hypothetical protein